MSAAYPGMRQGGLEGPPCQESYPTTVLGKSALDTCGNRLRGSRNAHQAARVQDLGDLHGVRRRALEQVVADDPHLQPARMRRIAPQTPDEDLVAAGGRQRRRVAVRRR